MSQPLLGNSHEAGRDSFEYRLWHALGNYGISSRVQTRLGNTILALAEEFLGIDRTATPYEPKRPRPQRGKVHYFRNRTAERPICLRIPRNRLDSVQITFDISKATCGHCQRADSGDTSVYIRKDLR